MSLGAEVGYCIRFEDCTSKDTRIRFVTDGVLVREMMLDPLLSRYSVVIVDEAHERSVFTDILLSLLKKCALHCIVVGCLCENRIMKRRPDLKVIISSATVDAGAFKAYFTRKCLAPEAVSILSVEGRLYPVGTLASVLSCSISLIALSVCTQTYTI